MFFVLFVCFLYLVVRPRKSISLRAFAFRQIADFVLTIVTIASTRGPEQIEDSAVS